MDEFEGFKTDVGGVNTELTWAHIFRALEPRQGGFPLHPLHLKAMVDMLGPQVACLDCWEKRDDCGAHADVKAPEPTP